MTSRWWLILALILAIMIAQDRLDVHNFRKRSMSVAEYSFDVGCYWKGLRTCNKLQELFARSNCQDDVNESCPKAGKAFRKALETHAP